MTASSTPVPTLGRARSLARTLVLGILVGVGSVWAGTTFVRAADDAGVFTFLLGDAAERIGLGVRRKDPAALRDAALPARRVRWTSRPSPAAPEARAAEAARAPGPGRPSQVARARAARARLAWNADRTVCVRTCDGYMFPLAELGPSTDLPLHEAACAAACPGAGTALFTVRAGQELDQAVSLSGDPYRRLANAFLYRTRRVASCSCRPHGAVAAPSPPAGSDPTLRAGDAVAARAGAQVFTGRTADGEAAFVEFRRARMLPAGTRRELDRRLDVSRIERARAVFRNSLRVREARMDLGRLPAGAAGGFTTLTSDSGFAPVRVVVPSPFR
ncbi:hypothetical protein OPKNFCMD_1553 [Methylobacterium crusticola]|uniref:DUF2865 domain-containing protein n=1 Tax=Methylobacterium crusticola TaxID=1697972 RepID=A0ABQ4QUG5_9HYPH|nr:DUF2865 domain-containing protein [Methylobacterium crusticola]GJD48827.1 hypothetical protein OPKNFCMD_1553 [Methylobacterium crusticola]